MIPIGIMAAAGGGEPLPDIDMTGADFVVGTFLHNPAYSGDCFLSAGAVANIDFIDGEADWGSVVDGDGLNRWYSQVGGEYLLDSGGGIAPILNPTNKEVSQ